MTQHELLKCLCGYLPYELKCKVSQKHKGDWEGIITDVDFINETFRIKAKGLIWKYQPLSNIKPILRPLSDLPKEIEHEGERFVPIDEFFIMYGGEVRAAQVNWKQDFVDNILYSNVNTLPYGDVQQLMKWHFDPYRLIDQGYAVNKNEIERC